MNDAQLQTIWQQRQVSHHTHLGEPLAILMKHTLEKRVKQVSRLAEIWDKTVPEEIAQHTALESFCRGVLTVMVDSAAHRFQLQTLLDGGLLKIIQRQFSSAIRKVRLIPGQFYSVDVAGAARYEF